MSVTFQKALSSSTRHLLDTTTEVTKRRQGCYHFHPDGSKDEVPVIVIVKDPRTDADKNDPTAKDQTVNQAIKRIGNVGDLPEGTKFEYETDLLTQQQKTKTLQLSLLTQMALRQFQLR